MRLKLIISCLLLFWVAHGAKNTIILRIGGMHSSNNAYGAIRVLKCVDGIQNAIVDLQKGTITIRTNVIDFEQLKKIADDQNLELEEIDVIMHGVHTKDNGLCLFTPTGGTQPVVLAKCHEEFDQKTGVLTGTIIIKGDRPTTKADGYSIDSRR